MTLPLPLHPVFQLLRKRHIGNDIVTIIFQEPGALPFTPKNIRSHFQHVFIIVRAHNPCTDNVCYRYAPPRAAPGSHAAGDCPTPPPAHTGNPKSYFQHPGSMQREAGSRQPAQAGRRLCSASVLQQESLSTHSHTSQENDSQPQRGVAPQV